VDRLIELLDLSAQANTIIGDRLHRGISGGQRKRLAIAVEIIHLPTLLFLDEPTTGLDSTWALEVIAFARAFADQNRTVLCTIHQPSPQITDLFDNLLLLSSGRLVYFGPFKSASRFFTSSPFAFPLSSAHEANPAEFVVSVASSVIPSSIGLKISGAHLALHFEESPEYATMANQISCLLEKARGRLSSQAKAKPKWSMNAHQSKESEALLLVTNSNGDRQMKTSWIESLKSSILPSSCHLTSTSAYPTSTWNQTLVLCDRVILKATRNTTPILLTTLRYGYI
jgi:ABC-type multidrug transport system ATPase subunit